MMPTWLMVLLVGVPLALAFGWFIGNQIGWFVYGRAMDIPWRLFVSTYDKTHKIIEAEKKMEQLLRDLKR